MWLEKQLWHTTLLSNHSFSLMSGLRRVDIGSPHLGSVPASSDTWVKFIPPVPGLSFPVIRHITQLNVCRSVVWSKEYHLDMSLAQDLKYLLCISQSCAQQILTLWLCFSKTIKSIQ